MASEAGHLRRRVMALHWRTCGARIPDELRAEVIRSAMGRRRHGDGLREITADGSPNHLWSSGLVI